MRLFEHQEKALTQSRQSIASGLKRPVIAAPTAFGKTVLAAHILKSCQDKGKRGWFFCDRVKLVDQTINTFKRFGIDFGVRQADHDLSNAAAPIQIASIQTVQAMVNQHNKTLPIFDMAIVDECHIQYEIIKEIIRQYDNIPIIGLSATPYSKGLGNLYNNLIVPITASELMAQGFLTPVHYYTGAHIDLNQIGSQDRNNYKQSDIDKYTDNDKNRIVGDLIKNWFEFANGMQSIAFSPTVATSKYIVERFNKAGIPAEHIDCYMSDEEKNDLYEAHDEGEFKILSCSRLLNTGYDSPTTKCVIDCYPTKSITTYVQRVGRITRKADGKEYSVYLDHSGNFGKFGYAEDIFPTELDDGERVHDERELTNQKEKKEPKTRDCPECYQAMSGIRCKHCGYTVPITEQIEDDGSMLQKVTEGTAANKSDPSELKTQFYSELLGYAKEKGRKPGWAAYQYKDKYGVWPNAVKPVPTEPTALVKGWIKHQAIKRKAAQEKGKETIKNMKSMLND